MKRTLKWNFACIAILAPCTSVAAQTQPPRPHILGISQVELYSTNVEATGSFLTTILGSHDTPVDTCAWDNVSAVIGYFNFHSFCSLQNLRLLKPPKEPPLTFLCEIAFAVDDVKAMKKYLAAKRIAIERNLGDQYFAVIDPRAIASAFSSHHHPRLHHRIACA